MNRNGGGRELFTRVQCRANEMPSGLAAAVTADGSPRWLGRQDTDAGSGEHHQAAGGLAADGLAAGDPAAARFGFIVTFAGPGRYPFRCQHPTSAGMADTFAVS
jgi:hypothetical protein